MRIIFLQSDIFQEQHQQDSYQFRLIIIFELSSSDELVAHLTFSSQSVDPSFCPTSSRCESPESNLPRSFLCTIALSYTCSRISLPFYLFKKSRASGGASERELPPPFAGSILLIAAPFHKAAYNNPALTHTPRGGNGGLFMHIHT